MLGNATRCATGFADRVQQSRFAVVDVTHDRYYWWTSL